MNKFLPVEICDLIVKFVIDDFVYYFFSDVPILIIDRVQPVLNILMSIKA